jgi:hypothetical protein
MSSPAPTASANHVTAKSNAKTAVLFKNQTEILAATLRGEVTKELQEKYQDLLARFMIEEKEKFLPYLQVMYEEQIDTEYGVQKKNIEAGMKFVTPSPSLQTPQKSSKVVITGAKWGDRENPLQIDNNSSPSSSNSSSSSKSSGSDWAVVSHGKPVPLAADMHHMTTEIWNDLINLSKIVITGHTSFIRKVPGRQRSEDGVSSLVVSRLNRVKEPNDNIVYKIKVMCTGTTSEGFTEIKYIRLEHEEDCSEGVCKKTMRYKTEDLFRGDDYTPMFHNIITEFWEKYYPRKTFTEQ